MKLTPQLLALIVAISSAVGSTISAIIIKLFGNAIDLQFDKKKIKYTDKRKLADEVINLISDAMSNKWNTPPTDYDYINRLAYQIEGIDEITAANLRTCTDYWFVASIIGDNRIHKDELGKNEIEYLDLQRTEANKLGDKLIKTAHLWKK